MARTVTSVDSRGEVRTTVRERREPAGAGATGSVVMWSSIQGRLGCTGKISTSGQCGLAPDLPLWTSPDDVAAVCGHRRLTLQPEPPRSLGLARNADSRSTVDGLWGDWRDRRRQCYR